MSAVLPDAAPGNWVDRHAPARLRPWLKLGRLDRPTGIWLLMLPGWQGIALANGAEGRAPTLWLLAAVAVGATLMRAAGCAFNDVVDRDIDAKVARTAARPVASGQISPTQAWAFLIACSLVSFLILLSLGATAIILGVLSLALVAAYPFMKRITWWPQAWLGLTFNWGALVGWAAVTGTVELPALLLYAGGVFWTLGYDTVYAVQDLEDDALAGVKSSARRLGGGVQRAVAVFYAAAAFCALLAGWVADLGWPFLLVWAVYASHMAWQASRVRLDDPVLCLTLFKSNRDAGLLLFGALVVGGVWR